MANNSAWLFIKNCLDMKPPKSYHFLSTLQSSDIYSIADSMKTTSQLFILKFRFIFPFSLLSTRLSIILPIILLLISPNILQATGTNPQAQKDILIIHSYHKGFSWTDGIEEAIRDGLSDLPDTQIFTEYLDSKRQDFAGAAGPFSRYLRAKYQYSKLSLIIVSDNNALTFLATEPVDNFLGVPVIFCGINNFSQSMLEDFPSPITGTVEEVDPAGTVRIISQLQPDAKRLYIISDASPTGNQVKAQTEQALASLKTGLELVWLHNLSSAKLLNKLSMIDKDDAILLLLFNRDASGTYYSDTSSARMISSSTKAPVYGLWDFYLGTGVVGGRMASSKNQGGTTATLARRFFKTGTLQGVIEISPNRNLFDASALRTHNIPETDLPSDAIVTGEPLSYRFHMFVSIGGALLTALFIIILLYMLRPLFSIKTKLVTIINRSVLSITSCFILCLLLLTGAGKYIEYQHFIKTRNNQLLETRKQTLVMMVEQAVNLVNQEKAQSSLSLPALQRKLLQQIGAFSYMDGAGYLFVLSYNGTVLSHSSDPTLIGKNLNMAQDTEGIYPAREVIRLAKQSDGAFVSYLWPKPNQKEPIPKLTYSMGIQDWEWAIASGLYLDDIDLLINHEKEKQRRFFLQELSFLIFTSILGLSLLLFVSRRLSRRVRKEITLLEQGLRDQEKTSKELTSDQYQIQEFSHIALGIRTAFSDLSDANAEILAKEQRFIDALHSSPDAMLLINKESLIACNRAAAHMLGYTSSRQLLNIHPSLISPPEQADGQDSAVKARKMIKTTINQGVNRFEWLHLRKDGSPIPIEVTLTLSPIASSSSNTVLQCVWRDLTHEKEVAGQMRLVEEQRRATLEESERMNRLMTGREERILIIKEEVNGLLTELGRDTKYGHSSHLLATDSDSTDPGNGTS